MADEQKSAPGAAPEGESGSPPAAKSAAPTAPKASVPPKTPPPSPPPPLKMASTPWEGDLPSQLKESFGAAIRECATYLGQNFVVVAPEAAIPVIEFLKLEADFDYLVDITAVDYPKREERFDLVYILYSFARNERIRVITRIREGFRPESATTVHLTANWLEREVYDMFGIEFANHPDLRRILMPEDWQGHPLRKDYSILKMDERWVRENLGIESAQ